MLESLVDCSSLKKGFKSKKRRDFDKMIQEEGGVGLIKQEWNTKSSGWINSSTNTLVDQQENLVESNKIIEIGIFKIISN